MVADVTLTSLVPFVPRLPVRPRTGGALDERVRAGGVFSDGRKRSRPVAWEEVPSRAAGARVHPVREQVLAYTAGGTLRSLDLKGRLIDVYA